MYEVIFYRDKDGKEPLLDYLKKLAAKSDKDSRINLNKILQYIDILKTYGTAAGEKYVKHIEGEIYELRPLRNRIMFAEWTGKEFILLSHFIKIPTIKYC